MNIKLQNVFFLLIFFVHTSYAILNDNKMISLSFKNTPVAIILQTLAEQQHLNLIIDDHITESISIHLQNVHWKDALDSLLAMAKLESTLFENILLITQKPTDHLDILQDSSAKMATIKLSYLMAKQLVQLIEQHTLLSPQGKLFLDEQNNSVVIYDTNHHINLIKQLIAYLDQPQHQVSISAQIVTINKESVEELGVRWGYQGHNAQTINHFGFQLPVSQATSQISFQLATLSNHLLNLQLSALEAENQLTIIASPLLLTTNRKTASIKQGTEIPYEVANGTNGATRIEFKEAVLGLEVTPILLNNGLLSLTLHISQNTLGQAIKTHLGGEALAIDTQEIKTDVIIKNGETIVLGGIFQQLKTQHNKSVPGLHKLPVIGNLFKYQAQKKQQRELMIFITPNIQF